MNPFDSPMGKLKFALGVIAGFLVGFLLPALAGASLIGLLIALHKGPNTGEFGSAILGQLASLAVTTVFGFLVASIWSKIDDTSHFGEGCVKGAMAGLAALFIIFVIGTCRGWEKEVFRDL